MIGPLKKIKARWQHLTIRSQVAVIFIKNHKAGTAVKRMWSAESYELLQTVASIEAEKMCIQQRCYWACPIRGNQDWVLKGLRAVTPIKSHGSLPFSGPEPVFGSQTHWRGNRASEMRACNAMARYPVRISSALPQRGVQQFMQGPGKRNPQTFQGLLDTVLELPSIPRHVE